MGNDRVRRGFAQRWPGGLRRNAFRELLRAALTRRVCGGQVLKGGLSFAVSWPPALSWLWKAGSGVAGRLLGELHARGEPEFGVDVGEVGLHGAR
jgi:hypothetical protein